MTNRVAGYAGSFDPFTLGHDWIVQSANELFDELHIIVADNPLKKNMFSLNERFQMVKDSVSEKIQVHKTDGSLVFKQLERYDVNYYVRGIRNDQDILYEQNQAIYNEMINDKLLTVTLLAPRDMSHISSTAVRALYSNGGWFKIVREMVPTSVLNELSKRYMIDQLESFGVNLHPRNKDFDSNWEKVFGEVFEYYSRPYHNIMHVAYMYSLFKELGKPNDVFSLVIYFATLCHDVVYYVANYADKQNEEASAAYFVNKIWDKFLFGRDICDSVKDAILGIKRGEFAVILHDLDYAHFADEPDWVYKLEFALEAEFTQSFGVKGFCNGRMKFLQGLIDKPVIFYTHYFNHQNFEITARRNINDLLNYYKGRLEEC